MAGCHGCCCAEKSSCAGRTTPGLKAQFSTVITDITQMTTMRLAAHDWIYSPCQDLHFKNLRFCAIR